jgi:DNA-binding transcriptional MerR regulator
MRVYTIVEIAKRLGRPRSTVVDWARTYEEYLPTEGSGRSLRFTESALEIFGLISKLKDDGSTNDHIKRQLAEVVKEIIIPMPTNDGNFLMQLAGKMVEMELWISTLSEQNRILREEMNTGMSELKTGQEQQAAAIEAQTVILSRLEAHKRKKFMGLF